ncbi:PREDICTED: putative FBD-associated F-box protein At5g56690 [Camelina sativa]|uniref:FBD-associated F-box protein At5g56690 n=1 Tax=Camelina sativa TaxID=90675 RepID=A0ABM0V637_CAMSA|nr:PREDICTED: putative FBD-associated F-box protein At5g56690 [Camelina sativa]
MSQISALSDDLLVKILSFLPTKVAVSTSVLSKQWKFLWMWLPKLEYDDYNDINHRKSSLLMYRYENLPLHRAPILESLLLRFRFKSENTKQWVGIAVSRRVRELSISYLYVWDVNSQVLLPCRLYSCTSLVTLKLEGKNILVDVPPTVCLPSLKTLQLLRVTYSNEDALRLLLSYCPVLEDLSIKRGYDDNMRALVVDVPSLRCLSLNINAACSSDDGCVIVTPSLKSFYVDDSRSEFSYLVEHMPDLEEADIFVNQNPEKLLVSITSVKRLSLRVKFNSKEELGYHNAGIVFNQLEHLKLYIINEYWSNLLVRLLKDTPKLRVLNLDASVSFY